MLGGVTYVPGPASRWAEFDDADAAGIRMLAVAPDARGRGGRGAQPASHAPAAGRGQIVLHSTD